MPSDNGAAGIDRRQVLKTLGVGGLVGLAGCSSEDASDADGAGDATDTDGGTGTTEAFEAQGPGDRRWIRAATSSAQSLNPLNVSDEATTNRIGLLYDPGSVTVDGPAVEGRLLSDWQLSDDARTVTYTVREGLEWGAGYGQVTADDYIAFVENIVYGDLGREQRPVGYTQTDSYVLGGERFEIERLGKLSFRVTLPQPRAYWLTEDPLRVAWIVPAGLIEKYKPLQKRTVNGEEANVVRQIGADPAVAEADLAGNLGPFTFERWTKGQKLVLSRNDDYYLAGTDVGGGRFEGAPTIEDFTYQVFDEQSTAYSALRAGDITATSLEARKVDEVGSSDGVTVFESQFGDGVFYLNLNHRVNGWAPIRESRAVRQAFAHLIDKTTLIDQIFEGHADPAATFHPSWGPFYPDDLPTFEPSVDRAREKFENGTGSDYGYDGEAFLGPDGEQVELRLAINNASQTGEIIGNYLKERLGQAGIAVTVVGTNFTKLLTQYGRNSVDNNPNFDGEPSYNSGPYNAGAYDEAISQEPWDILQGVGFSAAPFTPWQIIDLVLTRTGTFNYFGYTTDDYDLSTRIEEAATATSRSETESILAEMFRFLAREQPLTWLYNDNFLGGYRRAVSNFPEPDSYWDKPDSRTLTLRTAQ
ncbi:ABC transporter substrate-binding protein [Salinigranum salinum]|uniref:ABC transporter substrate-binding protein n=1 Tax=Salinigranum salinum TaxID=1364937 RepID=UPI001260F0BC|nr:ABC transporter substrate-binding protein [Salinigranum salinum]